MLRFFRKPQSPADIELNESLLTQTSQSPSILDIKLEECQETIKRLSAEINDLPSLIQSWKEHAAGVIDQNLSFIHRMKLQITAQQQLLAVDTPEKLQRFTQNYVKVRQKDIEFISKESQEMQVISRKTP